MTTYEINSIEKNRLDLLLRKELPKLLSIEISNSKIRRLIMAGCVVIDSRQVKVPSFTVFEKTKIFVSIDKEKLLFETEFQTTKCKMKNAKCRIKVWAYAHF